MNLFNTFHLHLLLFILFTFNGDKCKVSNTTFFDDESSSSSSPSLILFNGFINLFKSFSILIVGDPILFNSFHPNIFIKSINKQTFPFQQNEQLIKLILDQSMQQILGLRISNILIKHILYQSHSIQYTLQLNDICFETCEDDPGRSPYLRAPQCSMSDSWEVYEPHFQSSSK